MAAVATYLLSRQLRRSCAGFSTIRCRRDHLWLSACDRRDDVDRVALADRRLLPLQESNIIFISKDIDKAVYLIVLLEDLPAQVWVAVSEVVQHCADRLTGDVHFRSTVGVVL